MTPTNSDIEHTIKSVHLRFITELLACSESDLNARWSFRWDKDANVDWNVYRFTQALEAFKRDCRRWEEYHSGTCCVVETVRDKYLMPKIRAFRQELTRNN